MEVSEFNLICDQFTNKLIFETDVNGKIIRGPLNIRKLKKVLIMDIIQLSI